MMHRTLRQCWALGILGLLAAAPARGQGAVPSDSLHARPAVTDSAGFHWEPETPRKRPDLFQHASLSFASGLAVGLISEEPAAAAGTAVTLGIGKEVLDPHFDRTDLAADLFGAALATLVTHWLSP
jgi:hypothetical protein